MVTSADLLHIAQRMMNIDKDELVRAGVITESPGGSDWKRFNDEPLMFIVKLDDSRRDKLTALIGQREKRK